MKPRFDAHISSLQAVDLLPGAWGSAEYRALLELMAFDGVGTIEEAELQDMTLMVLQDLAPNDAAEYVLQLRLGDRLTKGQRQELSHEMLEDIVWDEYPDMSMHEELFHVAALLSAAFPDRFPTTAAASLVLELTALDGDARADLDEIAEPLLCRVLADGMSERAILHRLFGPKLRAAPFPEAQHILWQFSVERPAEDRAVVTILTTRGWLAELRGGESFASSAFGDGEPRARDRE